MDMELLEDEFKEDRIFFEVSRLGSNTHITIGYWHLFMLAHVAECVSHTLSKDVDIGFRFGVDYNTQVNPGIGDRQGIDHILDIGNRFVVTLFSNNVNLLLPRLMKPPPMLLKSRNPLCRICLT